MTEDRLAELMVKVVDRVATPLEQEELMNHLIHHPELRSELDQHHALRAITDGWVARLEHDLAHDAHEAAAPVRAERAIGVALVLVGVGVLGGFGLTALLFDAEAPLWVKIGVGALASGSLALLGSVVRQRLSTRGADRYSEVIR